MLLRRMTKRRRKKRKGFLKNRRWNVLWPPMLWPSPLPVCKCVCVCYCLEAMKRGGGGVVICDGEL